MSNPSAEDWKRMSKLVETFYNRPDAEPFREPVAWKEIGLIDYPVVIKKPMDLGTIKKKMKEGKYKTLYDVAEDVRLVWTNCMTYNQEGSDFYKLADALRKKWEEKYAKLLQDIGGAEPASESSKGNISDKRNFARALYSVSKEDLGKILVEVESKCPAAIVRNSTEDEVELNVDKISAPLLQELQGFVNNAKGKKKPPGGKKAKTKV